MLLSDISTKEQIYNNDYYEKKNLADYGALSEELFYSELYTSLGIVDKKFSDKILLMGEYNSGLFKNYSAQRKCICV